MGKSLNCHNSGYIKDRVVIFGSAVWFSGSANSTMPVTFGSERPLLPWQRKFVIFNRKSAITELVQDIRPRCLHLLGVTGIGQFNGVSQTLLRRPLKKGKEAYSC